MRTKHGASRLARKLEKDGFTAESIHGDKSQQARMEALEAFKEGKLQVLVATDVAARGLDIDSLPHVLNYELPHVPEDYIHRIGRTGRAGAAGDAMSFVAPEDEKYLADIEKLLKKTVPIVIAEGFDVANARPERPVRGARPHGERGAAPARTERPERAHRAPRETPRPTEAEAGATPRAMPERPYGQERSNGGERSNGDWRREERERAFALNPDQPLPAAGPPGGGSAAAGRPPLRKARPVPALLMKRPAKEPENA
jgi:ATP-dependent RNA helicase RhlE